MLLIIISLFITLITVAPTRTGYHGSLHKRAGDDLTLSTLKSNIAIQHGSCSLGSPLDCVSSVTADILQHYFQDYSTTGSIAHSAGNYAGKFFWKSTGQGQESFGSFDKSSERLPKITGLISNYVIGNNSAETCVVFGDNDGILISGLLAFAWDGQPVGLEEDEVESRLTNDCQYGNMLVYGVNLLQVEL